MPDLPRPEVSVTPSQDGQAHDLVIHRDGKAKSYRVSGVARKDIIKDAVQQVLGDRHSAEWLPEK